MRRLVFLLAVAVLVPAASAAAAPTITSISPDHGKAGTKITVSGSGFTGTTSVWFGTVDYLGTSLSVQSDGKLTVEAPKGIIGGTEVDVRVVVGGAPSTRVDKDVFTYDEGPGRTKVKTSGHHGPGVSGFLVRFSGHGSWSGSFHDASDLGTATYSAESSYSWDWAQELRNQDALMVYPTCGGGGLPNLCKAIGPGVALTKGHQKLTFSLNDIVTSPTEPAKTAKCSDSLSLTGGPGSGIGMDVKPSSSGKALTLSLVGGSPLAKSNNNASFFDTKCQGLDKEAFYRPGPDGDGPFKVRSPNDFFSFERTIPTHLLQSFNSVTIPVQGPSSGNGPMPNCGIDDEPTISCVQTGGWVGVITITRVHT